MPAAAMLRRFCTVSSPSFSQTSSSSFGRPVTTAGGVFGDLLRVCAYLGVKL